MKLQTKLKNVSVDDFITIKQPVEMRYVESYEEFVNSEPEYLFLMRYNDKSFGQYELVGLNLKTHPTAYVGVPLQSKLYGITYDKISEYIDVHGGLTFSGYSRILHDTSFWYFGWDYAHFGDYSPIFADVKCVNDLNLNLKKYKTEEILNDTLLVLDQLIDLEQKIRNGKINI